MRRLALPLAAGVCLAIAGIVLATSLRSPAPDPAATASTLATELRCPDCEGLSVAESPSRSAAEIRRQIAGLLADGRTPDEVRQHFVDRYGEWIMLAPRSPLPWLAPIGLLAAAVAGFALWLRRRSPMSEPPAPQRASMTESRRVRDEADALDA